jgi:hypothetical protein
MTQGLSLLQLRQPQRTGLMKGRGEDAAELAQQPRIQAVSFAAPQLALGKAPHLQRVDHAHGPAGLVQGGPCAQPIGPRGLQHTGRLGGQGRQQLSVACRGLVQTLHAAGQVGIHVVLAEINAYILDLFPNKKRLKISAAFGRWVPILARLSSSPLIL